MITRSLVIAAILAGACVFEDAASGQAPPAAFDRYGDPLPSGALLRLGTTRLQTKGGFAWLPDGKSLMTLKYGKVTFWDIADGRAIDSFHVPVGLERFSSYGTQLALSRDGKRLVCTDTKGAIAVCAGWAEGRVSTIVAPASETESQRENLILVILNDGQTFVTLRRTGELEFRDISTMAVRRTVALGDGHWASLIPVALSPDGKTLALANASKRSIVLVDTSGESEPAIIPKTTKDFVYSLAFLPDGRLMSSASIHLAKADDSRPRFQADIRLWDVAKREAVGSWPIDDALRPGCSLCVSPSGDLLILVFPDQIQIWDLKTRSIVRRIEGMHFWNASTAHVETDPAEKFLAVCDHDNYVRVWELATGKALFGEGEHEQGLVFSSAWTPDGEIVATSSRNDIFLWSSATGEVVRKLRGPRWGAAGLLFSPDGKELIVAGQDPEGADGAGAVWWHDADSGNVLRKFECTGQARLPVLSPDKSLLAFSTRAIELGGTSLQVIESRSGKLRATFDGQGEYGVAWTPDGQSLLSASHGSKVTQTHLATKAVVSELQLPHQRRDHHTGDLVAGTLWQSAFFRQGNRVLTAGTLPEIYAWDLTTGRKQWTIPIGGAARALVLSPDEKVIACVAGGDQENKSLQLFDVASQRTLAEFDLGPEHCQCLSFSPDGRRLLVGFADGTALIMDATSRQ